MGILNHPILKRIVTIIIVVLLLVFIGYQIWRANHSSVVTETATYASISDTIQAADLLNQIKEEEVKKLLIDLCEWELAPKAFNMEVLKDAIRKIHDKCIEAKIKEMSELAKKMSNPLDKARLMNEIIELRRKSSQL